MDLRGSAWLHWWQHDSAFEELRDYPSLAAHLRLLQLSGSATSGDSVAAAPAALADPLRDRYTLERELGRGSMAVVFLARDLRHQRLRSNPRFQELVRAPG
ncbi:MAG: hypothetical protein ACREOF_12135 [Gemmatimonadales bacterium]